MYAYGSGFEREIPRAHVGNRLGRGHAIGIILVNDEEATFIPGSVENASTFHFPVLYEEIEANSQQVVSATPDPAISKQFIHAAQKLEWRGCRAITASCGFSGNFQPDVAASVHIPCFLSSLLQVPAIMLSMNPNQKLGILSFNGRILSSSSALRNCGINDTTRIVISGAEEVSQGPKILSEPKKFDPASFGRELISIAKKMTTKNPDIGAILLECTIFPPYAHAIQEAVQLPIYDFTTMINWIQSTAVRVQFFGYM